MVLLGLLLAWVAILVVAGAFIFALCWVFKKLCLDKAFDKAFARMRTRRRAMAVMEEGRKMVLVGGNRVREGEALLLEVEEREEREEREKEELETELERQRESEQENAGAGAETWKGAELRI